MWHKTKPNKIKDPENRLGAKTIAQQNLLAYLVEYWRLGESYTHWTSSEKPSDIVDVKQLWKYL